MNDDRKVIDFWEAKLESDQKKREKRLKEREKKGEELSKKSSLAEKIKKALSKYGSFSGTQHNKKDEDK